jgi:hypothetical protein
MTRCGSRGIGTSGSTTTRSWRPPGGRHINGIENFWSQAKRHLRRFNGVPRGSFPLFLREVVWRHNTGTPENPLKSLRNLLRRK